MPDLGGSQVNSKRKKYTAYKRKLYHDVIYAGLASVRKAQSKGGFKVEFRGDIVTFYPVIACVVNDNPEGQLLSLVYGHAKANYPCRMCE